MRHRIVTRVVFALLALFVVCAGLFAWRASFAARRGPAESASRVQSAPTAAAPFDQQCASCHSAADLRLSIKANGTADPAVRRRDLETFLSGHTAATADDNRRILDDLMRP